MVEKRKRRRTTQQVKDDIIKAVGSVLTKYGVNKLGVETVAAEAGMDKAMLYRHYKDFNDILRTYVEQEGFWNNFLSKEFHLSGKNDLVYKASKVLAEFYKEMLDNKKLQELTVWLLVDKGQLMSNILHKREISAKETLEQVKQYFPHADVSSSNIIALLIGGISYLVLHKDISTYCGLDLNDSEHQKQFLHDLHWVIGRIFKYDQQINEKERIAINCINRGMDKQLISEITGLSIPCVERLKEDS